MVSPAVALNGRIRAALRLPRTLLVTMHAQLLAPFMTIDFCLAAFFE
jgi:hypothetical protein